MFKSKSEAENFLRSKHFSKTTKGLNISLVEYAVSEKDAKKALDMVRFETAKKIRGWAIAEIEVQKGFSRETVGEVALLEGLITFIDSKFLQGRMK